MFLEAEQLNGKSSVERKQNSIIYIIASRFWNFLVNSSHFYASLLSLASVKFCPMPHSLNSDYGLRGRERVYFCRFTP